MLYLLARLLALPELRDHGLYSPLLPPLGRGTELEMGRLDLVAVGVHTLPQIEYFGLAVEVEMQPFLDELPDLSKPLPRGLFARRNDDDVVHVPGIEFYSEEADAILIDFVEHDVREVLRADIPQGDARLSLRA